MFLRASWAVGPGRDVGEEASGAVDWDVDAYTGKELGDGDMRYDGVISDALLVFDDLTHVDDAAVTFRDVNQETGWLGLCFGHD